MKCSNWIMKSIRLIHVNRSIFIQYSQYIIVVSPSLSLEEKKELLVSVLCHSCIHAILLKSPF